MTIRVLGCSGAIAAGCRTTSFLLDEAILIDAGTGVGDLSLDEMARIDHILLSHSHLDHIVSIALLADTVMRRRIAEQRGAIVIHALAETIAALKTHIFNGVVWPDFTCIPSASSPALTFEAVQVGEVLAIHGRHIEVLPAAHTVPAVGYAVAGGGGSWVFTGDTGPNPRLWQRLAQFKVAHLVIETAFGNDEAELARISGHLCPATLALELMALPHDVAVHITHIKPGESEAVMGELVALGLPHAVSPLNTGQLMHFD